VNGDDVGLAAFALKQEGTLGIRSVLAGSRA